MPLHLACVVLVLGPHLSDILIHTTRVTYRLICNLTAILIDFNFLLPCHHSTKNQHHYFVNCHPIFPPRLFPPLHIIGFFACHGYTSHTFTEIQHKTWSVLNHIDSILTPSCCCVISSLMASALEKFPSFTASSSFSSSLVCVRISEENSKRIKQC